MTGLIYIVIIALWVAVLVPMWLRRHDQISEVRSTARFDRSMRSLGVADGHPAGSARRERAALQGRTDSMTGDARQEAAKRRAIVLASLCGMLVVTLGLSVASVLPMWVPVLSALLVTAFMVATALTAPSRSSAAAPVRRPAARRSFAEVPARTAQAPAAANRAADDDEWLNWNAWDDDASGWEAVPATLPTYVTAPRASAVPRPIDKVGPGEWSGEAMVDAAQAMRRRVAEVSFEDVDARAETAEIPAVRANQPVAVNE